MVKLTVIFGQHRIFSKKHHHLNVSLDLKNEKSVRLVSAKMSHNLQTNGAQVKI